MTEVLPSEYRYCLYARKSTEGDEKQALSIDSQIKEMTQIAEREKLNVVEIRRESHSAKESGQRPVFEEIVRDIDNGIFNAIITWAPDRLSRNAGDLGKLVDRMDQKKLITIKTFGQNFTNSPSDKFLLMILCSQAKLENDNKSINVKRGQRTRCEMGLWPAQPPTGYRKVDGRLAKCEVEIDPDRADIIKQIFEKIAYDKWSATKVHAWLKYDLNFRTLRGYHLSIGNVFKVINNTFYYGKFEFPKGAGIWYEGKHTPIITKELFDETRNSIRSQVIKSQGKEFAFTRIMKCGVCGSGITADEKFKKLKAGGVNRHVYYRCTKAKDRSCKNPAINETDLVTAMIKMLDTISLDQVKLNMKLNTEIQKFKKLQAMFLGKKKTEKIETIDVRDYARFVLNEGSVLEQRSVLECVSSELTLKNGKVISNGVT
ncbi:MAG TPA: recombinase family protein [Candidatus Paceibacterota bacterium]|nr:recombinase family protein [Candidatus Paceibacterota bacterium]HMO82971.1 recombinase family protein [Candidatus Paceibacterota bacterium]